MIEFVVVLLVMGVAAFVVAGFVRDTKRRHWQVAPAGDSRWRLTNDTSLRAYDVRAEVRGAGVCLVGDGELADVDAGADMEFATTAEPAVGTEAPTLVVTWGTAGSGRRHVWTHPLPVDRQALELVTDAP